MASWTPAPATASSAAARRPATVAAPASATVRTASRAGAESRPRRSPMSGSADEGIVSGSPGAGSLPVASIARTSSRARSGLPPAASAMRAVTARGRDRPERDSTRRRMAPTDRGPTGTRSTIASGKALEIPSTAGEAIPVRTPASRATGESPARRRANARAEAVGPSHHWRSSTTRRTGTGRAIARTTSRTARPSAAGSRSPVAGVFRRAISSARRRGAAIAGRTGSTLASGRRLDRAACGRSRSTSVGRATSGVAPTPAASRTAASTNVDLPIPAGPSSSRTRGQGAARNRVSAASSRSRPRTASPAAVPAVVEASMSGC